MSLRTLPLFFSLLLLISACTGGASEETTATEETAAEAESTPEAVTLVTMPETTDYPDATINAVDYQDGQFTYDIANYELGIQTPDADDLMCANSGQGQHIHLIIGTNPYLAKYEPTFEQDIEDGEHHILTFLSRSYHESIKHSNAAKAFKVTVENNNFTSREEITEPMLFYSRPKGTYTGSAQTKNIMLDFYPVNLELGADYQVRARINDTEYTIDEWRPYYIRRLPMGENTITLELIDGQGQLVDAPGNPVTRKITLEADPAEG